MKTFQLESPTDLTLISERQLRQLLGVSHPHVWALIKKGQFPPPIKLGRCTAWRWSTIKHFLDKQEKDVGIDSTE
jgi:predicted DNA-binding transcriptional regulator AlpA